MNNFDIAQKALETSLNSSGSAMAEHAKWQQSLEAQILKLKAAWQSLSQSFMDSNFLKGAMDAIIGLVDAVNWLIDTFGTLPTLIGAFAAFESFQGVGFFNTIKDEATGAATGITSAFSKIKVAIDNVKNDSTISFDTGFTQSLADDETALLRYRLALNSGMTAQEAFNATMQNASPAAQQYAKTVQITGESVQKFADQQKMSELSMKAQDKSWANCSKLINSYNNSMHTCGLTQEQFRDSIQASNPALHKYLSGLNGANGTFKGYIASLVGAKVATFALEAATMALNAAITMGISALVSFAIKAFDEMYESADELAERVDEITSKYDEQHDSLTKLKGDYDTSKEDSMISKYKELSKGVNEYGENVALTADEYAEYQSIVEQMVSTNPDLIAGYNSQGGAILKYAGDVNALTQAYKDLIIAQNQAIIDSGDDLFKDFNNDLAKFGISSANETNYTDSLKDIIESGYDAEKIASLSTSHAQKIANLIEEKTGIKRDVLGSGEKGYETYIDFIIRVAEEDPAAVNKALNDTYNEINSHTSELQKFTSAYLENKFLGDFSRIGDGMQSIISQVTSGFDAEFYSKHNKQSLQSYIDSILTTFNSLNSTDAAQFEAAFNLRTQFNGGEIPYGDYISGLQDASGLIDRLGLEPEIASQIKLSLGLSEKDGKWVVKEYDNLLNRLTSDEFEIQLDTDSAESFLKNLSSEELNVTIGFIEDGNKDFNDALQNYKNVLNEAEQAGVDFSKTVYGNIDTNARQVLEWNSENLEKYKDELMSWEPENVSWDNVKKGYEGTISTVMGTVGSYEIDGKEIDIAFSPMLQTDNGAEVLSSGTVDAYINELISKATEDGKWDNAELFALDATGVEVDGQKIKGILADIGETARATGEQMHFVGKDGALALAEAEINAIVEKQAKINEALDFTIAINVESESFDALNTAMAESVSAAGLSSESIAALKGRYTDLESKGYDLSSMFEETSNGIHLNRKAVNELEQAYASQKLSEADSNLSVLKDRYDELTDEINNCTNASERAGLYTEQQSIVQKINDLSTLAAQYEGLTSAYQAWQSAEDAGQERDMYENIIEGLENIDDEISRGWLDDGTTEFLELLTGKDLSTSNIDDLTAAYKGLKKEIGDSGYSVRDFFTVNEDGDSTNAGVYNFLETIESFDKLKSAIQRDSETDEITGFNFKVVGGDEAIAEALGISEELVQIMVRAADDAGFVVTLDGTYTQLADLKIEAESANDALKKLHATSNGKFGTDYTFDFSVSNIKDATTELDKALEVLNQYKKNGVIDLEMEGADEALKVAETLQIVKNKLEEPVYMSIETSKLQEDLQEPVELLQEYERLTQERDLLNLSGEDTERLNEIDTELTNIATELNNLPEDTKVKLGIDDLNVDQIKEELENGTIEIPTELTIEANMDKSLEDLVTLGLLEQGLITEKEARIRLGLEVDEVDTSAIEEALEEAEISEEQKVKIIAIAEVLGVENVEDLAEKLDGLTDEQIQVLAEVLGKVDVEKLKLAVNDLDDKTIKAIAKALGEGDVESLKDTIKGLDDKTVKAIANAFGYDDVEDLYAAIDKLDSKTVQAIANALGITDVESLKTAIDRLTDKNVDAVANVSGESEVNSLRDSISGLTGKTVDVIVNFIKSGWETVSGWFGGGDGDSGGSGVNGTANVNGTAFSRGTVASGVAFKQGDWSTKKSETALVGELGREIVVTPDNRWHTVGDNGAEFTHIPRGSIVFNHRQTEELLANGKVTSGGGRGKAFASGTAYAMVAQGATGSVGIGKFKTEAQKRADEKVKKLLDELEAQQSGSKGEGGGTDKVDTNNKSGGGGGGSGSSGGSSKDEKEFEETIDWIETKIDRIERAIDSLDQKASSTYKSWSERNTALVNQIGKVGDEIDIQQQAYDRYIKQANSVGLSESYASKVRDGTIDIQTITDEDLSEKIKDYQQWYNKALDCQKTIEELKETEASLYQQRFENVSAQYEGILGTIEHEKNMLEEYINQSETQGWLVSYNYYRELSSNEKRNIAELEKQKADMVAEFNAAMDSGTITKGSEAYYEMVNAIDEVSLSLEQANTRVMEISQTAQQLKWEQFDLLQDKISAITEETEFLIELMSSDKLFDENGQLTDSGMATMGQYGVAYNVLMQQADQARAEAERLERERARNLYNGTDKYDQDLEERYQEMIALQREYILAAEDQKEAIRDLVEEGIQLELDALDEKIEKYKDSLDSARDLYEYNKKVKEQSKEIANLEKQRAAYLGDASEEGKAKLQKIEVSLEEAKTELYETEMDKVIDNTSALLDELYLEYEEILNTRLDNIDALISDMIVEINANASTINGTISEKADSVGYVLSDSMESIWNTNSVEINSVITTYGEKFSSAQTATNSALKTINDNLQSMISQLNTIANTNIKSASVSSAKNYAVGKYDFSDDEVAWTQDGGKEFIVRPSDGAILTPIAKRDSVLTSVASRNIWDMANSPAEFIKDNLKLDTSNVPNGTNVHSNYTQHLEKVVFNFPNVKNYDDMLSAMQKDRNFERLINSITIDQIAGKSSLGKGKSIR